MKLSKAISGFKNKNILLLQGPIGPFFNYFAKKLSLQNNRIFKINFNGGDFIFYPFKSVNYTKSFKNYKDFIKEFYLKNNIEIIFCYNDTRKIHKCAIEIAKELDIEVYVFEEGYLRPNFITLEKDGVNANSKMSKDANFYKKYNFKNKEINNLLKYSFYKMCFYTFIYYLFSFIFSFYFNNKNHHRTLKPSESFYWIRHYIRLKKYKISDAKISLENKKYFLCVLQVFNDTQVKIHYEKKCIKKFIISVIKSFIKNADNNTYLVFKHHPMDIGYVDYSKVMKKFAKKFNIEDKIIYLHSGHLPTLLTNASGCVVANSTVGLSSIAYSCPTIVLAKAIYNIEGLAYQDTLDSFWSNALKFNVDKQLYEKYKNYLLNTNQINGSFYEDVF